MRAREANCYVNSSFEHANWYRGTSEAFINYTKMESTVSNLDPNASVSKHIQSFVSLMLMLRFSHDRFELGMINV